MASTYLSRTNGTPTSDKICTISVWVKYLKPAEQICIIGKGSANDRVKLNFNTNSVLEFFGRLSASVDVSLATTQVFRDTSAWYHIVCAVDTTQSTASDRVKIYVNGTQITAFSTTTYYPQNNTVFLLTSGTLEIGRRPDNAAELFDGSMSHFHFIDGTAYDASYFGETDATTGIWKPITEPSVTYGTNGFFLKFENSGSMGTDSSGNGNNFTVNGNLTQTVDTPANVFATMNPLSRPNSNANTFSNGNNTLSSSLSAFVPSFATLGMNSGKYYWEAKLYGSDMKHNIGISKPQEVLSFVGTTSGSYAFDAENARKVNNNVFTTGYGVSASANDIIMIAFDADNGSIWVGKNGTWFNSATQSEIENGTTTNAMFSSITMNDYFVPAVAIDNSSVDFNFGNGYFGTTAVSSATSDQSGLGIFEYTVPSGYYALCTKNINEQEYD